VTRTLPAHDTCVNHEHYLLSCADYEELLAESKGGCFICGFPAEQMPQKRLYIDHEGHEWAVRGLLCIRCNSGLGSYRHPTPTGAEDYLTNSWYRRKLAERGLSATPDEPPVGAIIHDHRGTRWYYSPFEESSHHWIPLSGGAGQRRSWWQMQCLVSAMNMRVIQIWDGRDYSALLPAPPHKRPPTRGALEKRITYAIQFIREHQWCPDEQEAVAALVATLAPSGP
jgi:hypothetical protein